MISVVFNGEPFECHTDSLQELLNQINTLNPPYVIAVNETFIPKTDYKNTRLYTGDRIECLAPMQGG